MAKIFRTEELQINGDNISIVSSDANKFQIKGKNNTVFLDESDISSLHFKRDLDVSSLAADQSSQGGTATTDVSSLQAQRDVDVANLEQDVSSLNFTETDDVSSLQAQREDDVDNLETDVSSLQAQREVDVADLEQDVSSLNFNITTNDVIVASQQIWSSGDAVSSVTVDLGREFASAPKVVGILKSSEATDPILGVMLQSVGGGSGNNHTATFVFSDDIASTNYTIEVLGSI